MTGPLRSDRAAVLQNLAERLRACEQARWGDAGAVVSSGSDALDGLLPEGGFRRGSLVEWLSAGAADGAATLALLTAGRLLCQGGALVVIDRARRFYPPAAARLGVALDQMILVRPTGSADADWALDQALRSPGVAVVWCHLPRAEQHALRRWQLAAETSGAVGLFWRPDQARHEPSWAELRLEVAPLATPPGQPSSGRARRLRVTLLRARLAAPNLRAIELEVPTLQEAWRQAAGDKSHETRLVPLASSLALTKTRRRPRRA